MKINAYKNHLPTIHESAYIDDSAKIIGDVIVGKDSSIWAMTTMRGDVAKITIGERTNIQEGCILHGSPKCDFYKDDFPVVIGNDVSIGHGVILHGCKIGDKCLIGIGTIILDGAEIESEIIIAAGSLVPPNKKLQSGYLYVGSPVKQMRALTETEKKHLAFNADYYLKLKNDFLNP